MDNRHEHVWSRKITMFDEAEAERMLLHVELAETAEVDDQIVNRACDSGRHGWYWCWYQLEGWWGGLQESKQHSEDWQCLIMVQLSKVNGHDRIEVDLVRYSLLTALWCMLITT
jgi:hypothetical protein